MFSARRSIALVCRLRGIPRNRHTHATALLLSGIPAHVVARRLGHADVQTTLNVYAWVSDDAELRAVADWRAFTAGWRTSVAL